MNINTVLQPTMELTVEYAGERIRLTVIENFLTLGYFQAVAETMTRPQSLTDALARIVVAWDITDNGKPWPVTPENVARCPYQLITAITTALSAYANTDAEFPSYIK